MAQNEYNNFTNKSFDFDDFNPTNKHGRMYPGITIVTIIVLVVVVYFVANKKEIMSENVLQKFGDSKVGQFLKTAAPEVAETIGDVLPNSGVLGIVKNIINTQVPDTNPDKVAMATELDNYEIALEAQKTAQIQSYNQVEAVQVGSDDKFTKRARPTGQYMVFLIFAYCYMVSPLIGKGMVDLPAGILTVLGGIVGAYTVGRTTEKINTIKSGK